MPLKNPVEPWKHADRIRTEETVTLLQVTSEGLVRAGWAGMLAHANTWPGRHQLSNSKTTNHSRVEFRASLQLSHSTTVLSKQISAYECTIWSQGTRCRIIRVLVSICRPRIIDQLHLWGPRLHAGKLRSTKDEEEEEELRSGIPMANFWWQFSFYYLIIRIYLHSHMQISVYRQLSLSSERISSC